MDQSFIRISKFRKCINIVTAVAFLLFCAYHTYLFVKIPVSRPGRMLGIISFFFLAMAAVFTLIPKPVFRILRTVLMIGGLGLNFGIKLLNAPGMFGALDFNNILSVLNCGVYVFSQLAELLLLIYYLTFRHNQRLNSNRKAVIIMMSVVIALYLSCLVMECVLIIKYRMNIDLSGKFTLLSRFLYFAGYVSIAVNFMLPVQEIDDPDDMMNKPPADSDLMFSVSESSIDKNEAKKPLPEGYANDLKFSHSENNTDNSLPEGYDDDLLISRSDNNTDNTLPEGYDDDFVM